MGTGSATRIDQNTVRSVSRKGPALLFFPTRLEARLQKLAVVAAGTDAEANKQNSTQHWQQRFLTGEHGRQRAAQLAECIQ